MLYRSYTHLIRYHYHFRQDQPTPWLNSKVTKIKSNEKVRICIDPRDLNRAILREHFHAPREHNTLDEVITQIRDASMFTKLDTTSGFWQRKLDELSTKLCTFNTPYGRYSFTRMPFWHQICLEDYQRAFSEMVKDIEGCEAIIDDILIWGKDQQQHDERLRHVSDRLKKFNLKLNAESVNFVKTKLHM